jgi:hypothetical protein
LALGFRSDDLDGFAEAEAGFDADHQQIQNVG